MRTSTSSRWTDTRWADKPVWTTSWPCSTNHLNANELWAQVFMFSFQEQVIQIKLHRVRRIYKRRHGLRPLVSIITVSTVTAVSYISRLMMRSCARVSPHQGSGGVLYWERLLLWHLPEVLQHSRQRRNLLLHRHVPGWDNSEPICPRVSSAPKIPED